MSSPSSYLGMCKPIASERKDKMRHIDIELTEARMVALFGKEKTERVKESTALYCEVETEDRAYAIGYNDSAFWTVDFLPEWLIGIQ